MADPDSFQPLDRTRGNIWKVLGHAQALINPEFESCRMLEVKVFVGPPPKPVSTSCSPSFGGVLPPPEGAGHLRRARLVLVNGGPKVEAASLACSVGRGVKVSFQVRRLDLESFGQVIQRVVRWTCLSRSGSHPPSSSSDGDMFLLKSIVGSNISLMNEAL